MDKFLETDSPPKMNQEELDKFEQIPRREIEFVLIKKKKKHLPANKVQDQIDGFIREFYQTQEELILILLKFFQKTEEERVLPVIL